MSEKQKKILKIVIVSVFLISYAAILVILNRPEEGAVPTSRSKLIFAPARVMTVIEDNASEDVWTEGRRLGTQVVHVVLEKGEHKGEELLAVNYLNGYANIDLKEGSRIIVRLDYDNNGNVYIASIPNYNRGIVLTGCILAFFGLLIALGGKKGAGALLGLLFTLISIWFFLIPLIIKGVPPIPAAILLVAITTAVSLVLLNGFTMKTLCATIGCIGGVAIAGAAASIIGTMTPINGFNMPEAEELVLRAQDGGLQISGLLVCGILIASLGAVMDVAITITAAVHELHVLNPKLGWQQLFKSGMNIGRDAMGTMTNTLILAFSGMSLNMLILFRVFDYPYIQIFNSDTMAIEIIQGLAGSTGVILTIPLVALISAIAFGNKNKTKHTKKRK